MLSIVFCLFAFLSQVAPSLPTISSCYPLPGHSPDPPPPPSSPCAGLAHPLSTSLSATSCPFPLLLQCVFHYVNYLCSPQLHFTDNWYTCHYTSVSFREKVVVCIPLCQLSLLPSASLYRYTSHYTSVSFREKVVVTNSTGSGITCLSSSQASDLQWQAMCQSYLYISWQPPTALWLKHNLAG